ncbi:MAG: hypothetical protein OXG35_04360 [Acidobacteria bacterium]|nr:hypothetical protein [Acidobacteriota bacterium]
MTETDPRHPWRTSPRPWEGLTAEALAVVADWLADTGQDEALEALRAVVVDAETLGRGRVSVGAVVASQHSYRAAGGHPEPDGAGLSPLTPLEAGDWLGTFKAVSEAAVLARVRNPRTVEDRRAALGFTFCPGAALVRLNDIEAERLILAATTVRVIDGRPLETPVYVKDPGQ